MKITALHALDMKREQTEQTRTAIDDERKMFIQVKWLIVLSDTFTSVIGDDCTHNEGTKNVCPFATGGCSD